VIRTLPRIALLWLIGAVQCDAGKPFVVLAVNLDEPEARIRKFLSQVAVDFAILLDPGKKAARAWNARVLPASFVIGPDGRIRYSLVGELDWSHDRVVSRIVELLPSGL
jgi:peroxiredoxin